MRPVYWLFRPNFSHLPNFSPYLSQFSSHLPHTPPSTLTSHTPRHLPHVSPNLPYLPPHLPNACLPIHGTLGRHTRRALPSGSSIWPKCHGHKMKGEREAIWDASDWLCVCVCLCTFVCVYACFLLCVCVCFYWSRMTVCTRAWWNARRGGGVVQL